jgi:hypothetical protein
MNNGWNYFGIGLFVPTDHGPGLKYGDETVYEDGTTTIDGEPVNPSEPFSEQFETPQSSIKIMPRRVHGGSLVHSDVDFLAWLSDQKHRDDPVGDLAFLAATDPERFEFEIRHRYTVMEVFKEAQREWRLLEGSLA